MPRALLILSFQINIFWGRKSCEVEDLENEKWGNIDYDKDYKISTFGRIKSSKNGRITILNPLLDKDGYLQIALTKKGKHKWFKIHRLVAEAFIPNPENKTEINHIFGVKFDNYFENIEWNTREENQQHANNKGLVKSGENSSRATLTNEQALYCRKFYIPHDKEFGASALARNLGVSREIVRDIVNFKTYKNI